MGRWDGRQSMTAVVHTQSLRDMKSYEKVVVELPPIWKIGAVVKLDHFQKFQGENEKISKKHQPVVTG